MLDWLLFLGITLGGAMVPGANLAIVLRNTLSGSVQRGFLTALGLASALLVHGTLSLAGITALIHQYPALLEVIRWGGAGYLLLLGFWQLLHRQADNNGDTNALHAGSPFLSGLLISLFNPKVLLFFMAIFAQVLSPEQPLVEKALYVLTPPLAELIWFSLVLTLLSQNGLRVRLMRAKRSLERVIGGALIALGIKLGLG